jgi:tRNA pseudouridine55 synthase
MPLEGFLNVLKPPGMTSHDVVAWARARFGLRRIGHLGTLDPVAAGVLPLALGRATRLSQFASGADKTYRAEIVFGCSTDTQDAEGRITELADTSGLTEERMKELLAAMIGEQEQIPPAFSAVSVGGRRLHKAARAGEMLEAAPRKVTIHELKLIAFYPGPQARALVDITCNAGTYIRVIARDLGQATGYGAYLGFLVRTQAGRFRLEESHSLEEIQEAVNSPGARTCLLPMDWPLAHLPEVILEEEEARHFLQGALVATAAKETGFVRVYGPAKSLLGIAMVEAEGFVKPIVVLAPQDGA